MTEHFENQEAKDLKNQTSSDTAVDKRTDHMAEKAAEKATKTEQLYDKGNPIFSK
ncbi:MAG: hypothetical protein WB608_22775 [Terracidiphilus sp.]